MEIVVLTAFKVRRKFFRFKKYPLLQEIGRYISYYVDRQKNKNDCSDQWLTYGSKKPKELINILKCPDAY